MKVKIIQINIYRGAFLDKLVEFLQKEQPDIVTMQEVTGGAINFWHDKGIDTFKYIKEALALEGAFAPMYRLVGDASAYEGNAVLVRGKILSSKIVQCKAYREYEQIPWVSEGPGMPRNALDLKVEMGGSTFHVLGTHGAWTKEPIDTPEKIRQARILSEYISGLGDEPFVLGGDFNMESGSEVINIIDAVAHNAVHGSSITNTLNLRTHRAAAILGPKGKGVDFIYTSPHFKIISIDAPEVDVSDHLPVRATLSLY